MSGALIAQPPTGGEITRCELCPSPPETDAADPAWVAFGWAPPVPAVVAVRQGRRVLDLCRSHAAMALGETKLAALLAAAN